MKIGVPQGATVASEHRQVIKHSAYLLAARLFVRLASVPFLLYAAATLHAALFGIFSFTLATVDMLSALGDFGLSRYGARALVRESEGQPRLAGIILVLQLLVSAVLTVPAVIAVLLLTDDQTRREVLLLGLAAAFLSSFVFATDTIFTAVRRFGASAVFSVAGRIVYLAAGFAALALGYSVVAVTAALLLSMAVESLLRMIYTARRITPFSFGFDTAGLRRVLLATAPFTVSAVATLVYFRADTLILELLRGDTDVGIYSAAYSFFSFFVWLPIILTRTLLPGLTRRHMDDPQGAARLNWTWYRWAGIGGIPLAFGMTMLAGPLIRTLMPAEFSGAIIALQILMWSIPPLMMVSVGFNALVVTDMESVAARTTLATAVIIVALDFALIPHYGPSGAAAAMVAATVAWLIPVHWLMARRMRAPGIGGLKIFGPPAAAAAGIVAAALLAAPLGIAASLPAGLAAYAIIAFALLKVWA